MDMAPLKPRVLVVEDDPINAIIIEDYIWKIEPKCAIDWVKSEEHAEKMIEQAEAENNAFDLVIADYYLSGQRTGVDLVNRYHGRVPYFILMSAAGKHRVKPAKIRENENYFVLDKPVHEKELAARLPKIFARIG